MIIKMYIFKISFIIKLTVLMRERSAASMWHNTDNDIVRSHNSPTAPTDREKAYTVHKQIRTRRQQVQYYGNNRDRILSQNYNNQREGSAIKHSLQGHMDRLARKFTMKNKQFDNLNYRCNQLQHDKVELEDYAAEMEKQRKYLADKLADFEIHTEGDQITGQIQNKMTLMSTELMRLGRYSRAKQSQIQQVKSRMNSLIQQNERLQRNLNDKDRLLAQYRSKDQIVEQMIGQKKLTTSNQVFQLRQRLERKERELERAEFNYKRQRDEIMGKLNAGKRELETTNRQILQKNNKINTLQQEVQNFNTRLQSVSKKCTMYEEEGLKRTQHRIAELEQRMGEERTQWQKRVKQLKDQYQEQINAYKNIIKDLEYKMASIKSSNTLSQSKYTTLNTQIEQLKTIISDKNQQLFRTSRENEGLQGSNRNAEKIRSKLSDQNGKLREELAATKERYQKQHQTKMKQIRAQIISKEEEVNSLKRELNCLGESARNSYQSMEIQTEKLKHRYEEKVLMLQQEVQRLEYLLSSKDRQLQEQIAKKNTTKNQQLLQLQELVKEKHRNAQQFKDSELTKMERDRLRSSLNEMGEENSRLMQKVRQLEQQNKINKDHYEQIIERQRNIVKAKTSGQASELQEIKKQMDKKLSMLMSERQQLIQHVQSLKLQLNDRENEKQQLKKDLARVREECQYANRQKEKYRLASEEILSKIHYVKGEDAALFETINETYRNKMQKMSEEMEKLAGSQPSKGTTAITTSRSKQPKTKHQILEQIYSMVKNERQTLQDKLEEYEMRMAKMKAECQKMNKLVDEYKEQNQYLQKQNHSRCMLMSANPHRRSYTNENVEINQGNMQSEIYELEALNTTLNMQLQHLRQTLHHKSSQIEKLMTTLVGMAVEIEALRLQPPQ